MALNPSHHSSYPIPDVQQDTQRWTTQTPPPPPPPPPGINPSRKAQPRPRASHAAIPYSLCRPVQETSPPLEALYGDPALSSTTPGQSQPQPKASEEHGGAPPLSVETTGPVQETDPAPQTQVRSEEEEEEESAG